MANHFDELAMALAEGLTRREALRRIGGGFAGALLASLGLGKAWAGPNPSAFRQNGGASCGPVDCNLSNQARCPSNPHCYCATTVENVDTCFSGGQCFACVSSADCVAKFGPGSACVGTARNCGCQRQGRRACVFPCS